MRDHGRPTLLLINPIQRLDRRRQRGWNGNRYVPPLGLGYVAALTPPGWEVRIVDENAGDDAGIVAGRLPSLVGITSYTPTIPRAYELAAAYRRQGVPVVIGGCHASALPQEVLDHADCAFVGQAEGAWPRLVADLEAGRLQPLYDGGNPPLTDMPLPRRDLYPRRYLFDAVLTSKGCPYRCEFCSVWRANGQRYLARPVEEVIAELQQTRASRIFFVDDNFTVDVERATELCRRMAESRLHKRFAIQTSLDVGEHPELLHWLRAAGCFLVFVGIESVHEESLRQIRKAANLRVGVARYAEMVRRIQAHGMAVSAGVIFGTDAETPESQTALERFVLQTHIDSPVYTILTPTPGTDLWERLESEGRLRVGPLPEGYGRLDAHHVAFEPASMTAGDLAAANRAAVLRATSPSALLGGAWGTLVRTHNWLAALAALRNNLWARQNLSALDGGCPLAETPDAQFVAAHP
ncbi:MAG: B12-binding domain-containing radical SAM protein [Anaerolineae bacterium]